MTVSLPCSGMEQTSRAGHAVPDVIALQVPSDVRYLGVVRLVLGGLATRIECPVDQLDDLQLATETVVGLATARRDSEPVTIEIDVGDGGVAVSVGSVDPAALDSIVRPGLDLAHVLRPLVDGVELFERDDEHWLRLDKRFDVTGGATR